ncbi:MAG: hypothetical protein OWT28_06920 [Firmicutes bacterium]|nr:hypothetical protein [Bacillota bacterium]
MIDIESHATALELELLCERLMICAFAVQDDPEWGKLADLLQSAAQLAGFLKDREAAYHWTEQLLYEHK